MLSNPFRIQLHNSTTSAKPALPLLQKPGGFCATLTMQNYNLKKKHKHLHNVSEAITFNLLMP